MWSLYAFSAIGLVVGLLVLLVCFIKGAATVAEAEPALPKVRKVRGPLMDGTCPVCGAYGVYLNRDGSPNRRHHTCPERFTQRTEVQP